MHCRRIYTRSLNFFNRLLCKPFCSSEKEQKCIGTLLNVIATHVNQRIPGNSEGIAFTDEVGLSDSFYIVQEKAWNPEPAGGICLPFKQSLLRSVGAGRSDWQMTRPDNNKKKNKISHYDAGTFQSPLRSNTSASFPLSSPWSVRCRQSSSTWHLSVWTTSRLQKVVTIILDCEDTSRSIPVLFFPSFLGLLARVTVHTTCEWGSQRAMVKQY